MSDIYIIKLHRLSRGNQEHDASHEYGIVLEMNEVKSHWRKYTRNQGN